MDFSNEYGFELDHSSLLELQSCGNQSELRSKDYNRPYWCLIYNLLILMGKTIGFQAI